MTGPVSVFARPVSEERCDPPAPWPEGAGRAPSKAAGHPAHLLAADGPGRLEGKGFIWFIPRGADHDS